MVTIGLVFYKTRNCLCTDARRRTKTIAISHLSDSGDPGVYSLMFVCRLMWISDSTEARGAEGGFIRERVAPPVGGGGQRATSEKKLKISRKIKRFYGIMIEKNLKLYKYIFCCSTTKRF